MIFLEQNKFQKNSTLFEVPDCPRSDHLSCRLLAATVFESYGSPVAAIGDVRWEGRREGRGVFAKTGEEQKVRVGCPNGRETENGNILIVRLQKNSDKQAHLHSV